MSKIATVVPTTKIVDVTTRKVKNDTMTLWDVTTPDGTTWVTFNAAIGNKAIALKGQVVDLSVEIEQKEDGFTNYYIKNVRATEGAQPTAAQPGADNPVIQAALAAQAAQAAAPGPAVSYDQYKSLDAEKEARKTESIHRQTATKAAAMLSDNSVEFWANVKDIIAFYETGVIPMDTGTGVTSHTYGDATAEDNDIPF